MGHIVLHPLLSTAKRRDNALGSVRVSVHLRALSRLNCLSNITIACPQKFVCLSVISGRLGPRQRAAVDRRFNNIRRLVSTLPQKKNEH